MNREDELEIAEKHLVLPENTTLQLIASKFMTDSNYRDLVVDTYDAKIYMDNPSIAAIIECQILYHNKYNIAPTFDTLREILIKYCQRKKNIDPKIVQLELEKIRSDETDYDHEVIKDSVVDFITSKITYYAVVDNFEIIRTKKDVSVLLGALEKVSSISLDYDLGMLYYEYLLEHLEDLKRPESKIATGFKEIDHALNGGLHSDGKCLALFLAPSHVGKSLMLSNIAVNMLMQNKFVVIISLEMSEHVYASRIDAHISELGINDLPNITEELGVRVQDFEKLYPVSRLVIKEFPPNSVNSNNLRSYLDRLVKHYGRKLDAIFVDYVGLVNPIHGLGRSTYEKGGDVAKELRALSYYFNAPVISAVQSTRDSYDTSEIGMQNTGESIGIPQTADAMFTLYQLEGDREMSMLRSKIIKNRLGGRIGDQIDMKIDYNTLRIYDNVIASSLSNEAADIVTDIEQDLI